MTRKVIALVEIVAAVVLAVSSVVGYIRVKSDTTINLVNQISIVASDYKMVAMNVKQSFDAVRQTVPHWREALNAGKSGVARLKETCDDCANKIPVPEGLLIPDAVTNACQKLKQIPRDFSESCVAIDRGLEKSIEILDKNMSENECKKTLRALDNTIASLEAAEKCVSGVKQDIKSYSLTFLIIMLAMSVCFLGNGITTILEKNPVEGVKWLRKAAEQNFFGAPLIGGWSSGYGTGVEKSPIEAIKGIREAARQGNAEAMYCLGCRYLQGDGVEKNPDEAIKLLRGAAERNHVPAHHRLGLIYIFGAGVKRNKDEGVKWLRSAAERGDKKSRDFLRDFLKEKEF